MQEKSAHLDASDKHFHLGALIDERGCLAVNRERVGVSGKRSLDQKMRTVANQEHRKVREGTAFRIRGRHEPIGPHSSIGSPMTFMMRPRVARPTGICDQTWTRRVGFSAGRKIPQTSTSTSAIPIVAHERRRQNFGGAIAT